MALTAAKCTQCGANIEVDRAKDAGICSNCGTAFITEKAINNYVTNISNTCNIRDSVVNIYGKNINALKTLGDEAYGREDYKEAYKLYTECLSIDISDYEVKFRRYLCKSYSVKLDEIEFIKQAIPEIKAYLSALHNDSLLTAADKNKKRSHAFKSVTLQVYSVSALSSKMFNIRLARASDFLKYVNIANICIRQILSIMEMEKDYLDSILEINGLMTGQSDKALVMIKNLLDKYSQADNYILLNEIADDAATMKNIYYKISMEIQSLRQIIEPDFIIPKALIKSHFRKLHK